MIEKDGETEIRLGRISIVPWKKLPTGNSRVVRDRHAMAGTGGWYSGLFYEKP